MRTITMQSREAKDIQSRVESRCSVCYQAWGEGAYSRHECCVILRGDGSRIYGVRILTAQLSSGEVVRVISE